jgi:hypothetical protein
MTTFDIVSFPFRCTSAWSSISRLSGGRAPRDKDGIHFKTHDGGGETPLQCQTQARCAAVDPSCGPASAAVFCAIDQTNRNQEHSV